MAKRYKFLAVMGFFYTATFFGTYSAFNRADGQPLLHKWVQHLVFAVITAVLCTASSMWANKRFGQKPAK